MVCYDVVVWYGVMWCGVVCCGVVLRDVRVLVWVRGGMFLFSVCLLCVKRMIGNASSLVILSTLGQAWL